MPGVKTVQVSRIVKPENAASEKYTGVDQTWQTFKHTGQGRRRSASSTPASTTPTPTSAARAPSRRSRTTTATVHRARHLPDGQGHRRLRLRRRRLRRRPDTRPTSHPASRPGPARLQRPRHPTSPARRPALGRRRRRHDLQRPVRHGSTLTQDLRRRRPAWRPEATLKRYRVFGCDGIGRPTDIIDRRHRPRGLRRRRRDQHVPRQPVRHLPRSRVDRGQGSHRGRRAGRHLDRQRGRGRLRGRQPGHPEREPGGRGGRLRTRRVPGRDDQRER